MEITKQNVEMYIILVGKTERDRGKDELSKDINDRLKSVPNVERLEMSFGGQGGSAPVQLQVIGEELETAEKVAKEVETMLTSVHGVQNVRNDFSE
ncbi:hypothetical protein MOQ26_22705, partial [Stenotrophomonas maltophilia]|nr:hypothetical protein [Stenotrophomonas maltophilia]